MSRLSTLVFTASLASLALARTDLIGCTSTDVSSPAGASVAWYVPGTGELCDFLDCGGGMAPPKTTVPGCPLYSGTATYSPSYLPGYGSMTGGASQATSSAEGLMSASYGSDSLGVVPPASSTMTGAWSETNTSLDNSANSVTDYETASASASWSSGVTHMVTTTSSSSPVAPVQSSGTAANGTASGSGSSGSSNGTSSSATPSPIQSDSGAMETARVWLGGSALIGLGAIVAAL